MALAGREEGAGPGSAAVTTIHAPFPTEVECKIGAVPRQDRLLKSWPELQIRITQLVRERSPPPDLRLPPAKLSRKTNWVARGRIRQFESDMPSQQSVSDAWIASPHSGNLEPLRARTRARDALLEPR